MEFDLVYLDAFHADQAEQYGQTVYRPSFDQVSLGTEGSCSGCGRPYVNGECLMCDGDGNPWDGQAVESEPIPADVMEWFMSTL